MKPALAMAEPSEPGSSAGTSEPPECGSYAGYRAHINRDEDPCDRCKVANAAYMRSWRASQEERPCACCGLPGRIVSRGWRQACYERWNSAGRPAGGPPPPRMSRAQALIEYRAIRGTSTDEVIAERLGVGIKTIRRYEAALRQAGLVW
ncbi:hypothetical protein NE236_41900 [Actinoallomurus purpureus]|uniref:hypothetical protein n=1 Tax=Actinoallomurus purpureus TaxID=478114 RepID=UPI002092E276|nr:hypothetical protein [Actinoallomurus purpureus]MCO6011525.1 hypothetical protein [Actinoallomurus purpureus]